MSTVRYEKGDIVDGYKVSMPLGADTYRVRDDAGLLFVLKAGAPAAERAMVARTALYAGAVPAGLLMHHVAGESLAARLDRVGALPPDVAEAFVRNLLEQLAPCHAAGFAHNGITADNVLIDMSVTPKRAWLIGHSRASFGETDFSGDCAAIGRLAAQMLSGAVADGPVKVSAAAGKDASRLNELIAGAMAGSFSSAAEMLDCLNGNAAARPLERRPLGPGFAAVAGMEPLKRTLRQDVIEILADREGAKAYGLTIPNGMLLYGPPGCGKTFIAERFAEEAAYNYKYVKSSDLASVYLHGSQQKIAELFDEARRDAPTILCFDEFDALVPRRDDVNNASYSAEVNEFLSQLNNCGADGVFVIATTNRPDRIDPAVIRTGRIDCKIYVPAPDADSRKALFEIAMKDRTAEKSIDFAELASMTEGYLASDIAAAVQAAARSAFREKVPIGCRHLVEALKTVPPSLSKKALAEYERARDAFENNPAPSRPRVGF